MIRTQFWFALVAAQAIALWTFFFLGTFPVHITPPPTVIASWSYALAIKDVDISVEPDADVDCIMKINTNRTVFFGNVKIHVLPTYYPGQRQSPTTGICIGPET